MNTPPTPAAPPPRTEESLQTALAALADARTTGNQAGAGEALLQLAYLVKWVRSDNDDPPFPRSHTLALEALDTFRQLGDPRGECRALLAAAPFEMFLAGEPEKADGMLERAQALATECGDRLLQARALVARGAQLALRDRAQARALTAQALAMFRTLGDSPGIARCLLCAALQSDTPTEKRELALEASRLYRQLGDPQHAAFAIIPAIGDPKNPGDLAPVEQEVQQILQDAISAGNNPVQQTCQIHLSRIAEARGTNPKLSRGE